MNKKNNEQNMQKTHNRRSFLKKMAMGGALLLTSSTVLKNCDDSSKDKNKKTSDSNDNGKKSEPTLYQIPEEKGTALSYPGDKLIIARDEKNKIYALSNVCTHQACYVKFNSSSKKFECPCHESIFKLDGSIVRGIAKRPLDRYKIKLKGASMVDVNTKQVYKYGNKGYNEQFITVNG